MKDMLHELAIQRNELRNALAEVIDKIQSGVDRFAKELTAIKFA